MEEIMEEIMVSIRCMTYNHEKYIEDTIKGFISQKVNFQYEVIIHDDASTDGTADVIRKYEKMYPQVIKGIYQKENQYSKGNDVIKVAEEHCIGKYIALCEGDDFWIDQHKLQIQVDYMESHPECFLVGHDVLWINCANGKIEVKQPYEMERDLTPEELIVQWYFPTASTMYRREILQREGFFRNVGIGDYPMALYALSHGSIHYFTRVMSVYRYMHQGSWSQSQTTQIDKRFDHIIRLIYFMDLYNAYTHGQYRESIAKKIESLVITLLLECEEVGCEKFNEMCIEYAMNNFEKKELLAKIKIAYKQVYDPDFYHPKVKKMVGEKKHILIYGAGKYGTLVAEKFQKSGIEFEGFLVSDGQKKNSQYLNKPIWELSELPFEKDRVGVIGAVRKGLWAEIKDSLEGNLKYIYFFDVCDML